MTSYSEDINIQYGRQALLEQILVGLTNAGKDIDKLTRDDLKSFDEFHIGGIVETRNLANRMNDLSPKMKILDIGSGLGGSARTLAAEFGNQIVGLDLTEEYCIVARDLTERVNLSDKISFIQGNALDLPFEENSFDVIWSQFVSMNIENKLELYKGYQKTLRQKGYFAFHEVIAGDIEELHYPVFWADRDSLSFLKTYDEMLNLLESCGFQEVETEDLSKSSTLWFENIVSKNDSNGLGFDIFVGPETPVKAKKSN